MRAAGELEHLPSETRSGLRPTLRWRRFYRIRLSFDQRRAGAQPRVATVQIHPAPPAIYGPRRHRRLANAGFESGSKRTCL